MVADLGEAADHPLEAYIDSYIEAAGIRDGAKAPLFRSAAGRTGMLTATARNRSLDITLEHHG